MRTLRGITRKYDLLKPEERLSLIIAAGVRGDDAEQQRLIVAARPSGLAAADYLPFAHAFRDFSMLTFIELLEETGRYRDAIHRLTEEGDATGDGNGVDDLSAWEPALHLALAAGYVLKTKAEGWKLFCERLHVPPFVLMEFLPGFDRLEQALNRAEKVAFVAEGFLRWLNRIRPEGEPEVTDLPLTAERVAAESEGIFRKQADKWSGVN